MVFRVTLMLAGMGAGVIAWPQQPSAPQAVLLRDVRLIDGTGAPPREHVSLLLRDGRIAAIGGPEVGAAKGVPVRDMSGKTVMPGLISAHSHLGLLVDDAENSATAYTRENVAAQLKQFERYGVTTIMSLGVNRDLVYELRAEDGPVGRRDDPYGGTGDWCAWRCAGTAGCSRSNLSADHGGGGA
jgi:hypothetical protein